MVYKGSVKMICRICNREVENIQSKREDGEDGKYIHTSCSLLQEFLYLQKDVSIMVEIMRLLEEMYKTDCYLQAADYGYNLRTWYVLLPDRYEGSDYTVAASESLLECLQEAELKGWDF